ncbi:MAG: M48 family metalloprotease [Myxococcota bacterium]
MTRTHPSSRLFRNLAAVAVTALFVVSLGCATNPVTGKNEFLLTSQAKEIRTGAEHFPAAREAEGGTLTADPELEEYVSEVGTRIAEVSDRPDLPYEFIVINSSQPHAWALPGGKIAVTRGLLVLLENEGQLAAVLSHQIVHTAAKHRAKSLERSTMKTVAAATVALGAAVVGIPAFLLIDLAARKGPTHQWLVHAAHSEGEEMEADRYGIEYMQRAGYRPDHAVDTLRVLGRREAELTPQQEERTIFVAHPMSRKRSAATRIVAYQYEQRQGPAPPEPEDRYAERLAWLRETAPAYAAADTSRSRLLEGDYDSALVLIRQAQRTVPEEASFRESEGDVLMMKQRFQEAFTSYDQAIRLRPDRTSAWVGRGMASKALGDTENAMADFEISYRLFPNKVAANELYDYRYRPRRKPAEDNEPAAETTAEDPDDPDSPAFAARHPGQLDDTDAPLPPVDPGSEGEGAVPLVSENTP